jgi:hypothetical protein
MLENALKYSLSLPRKEIKTVSLTLIATLIYTIVGVCLAKIEINLVWWLSIVLLYHWCLLRSDSDLASIVIVIVAFYLAIVTILDRAEPSLSLSHILTIGFFAALALPSIVYLNSSTWGREKAISFSTSIAWLGLIIGWLVSHYPSVG